jgi:glycosyltransferase involved in cell wall biosynthesis
MNDLISIIIPDKDRPALLREAVESVVAQRPVEIIIVLTGAIAATKTDAEGLSKRFPIHLVETAPLNLAATRNAGLAVAKGDWVSCLDDDDVWLPGKLAKQMQMARQQHADLVTTNWVRFGDGMVEELWAPRGKSPLPVGLDYRQAFVRNNYVCTGALVKTEVLRGLGGFDEAMRACEDWDMWRRVVLDHRIAYLDEGLMRVRVHNQNMSSNRWLMRRHIFKHLLKMSFELPADLRRSLVFAWHYWRPISCSTASTVSLVTGSGPSWRTVNG